MTDHTALAALIEKVEAERPSPAIRAIGLIFGALLLLWGLVVFAAAIAVNVALYRHSLEVAVIFMFVAISGAFGWYGLYRLARMAHERLVGG